MNDRRLVIFGASNMVSDLFDCAHAAGIVTAKVILHHDEHTGARDVALRDRVESYAALGPKPAIQSLAEFVPADGELYILGPTTPARAELALLLERRFGLRFCTLVHPTAYVSPLASLGEGTFVGARSVVAAGAVLAEHVFVNRGVTIGHDTGISAFSRLQPGADVASLSKIGVGVTVGIGATMVERLRVGDHSVIAAGAVVINDVPQSTLAVGVPARMRPLDSQIAAPWIEQWLTLRPGGTVDAS